MTKFQNKYRIESHRKPNWDYSADALYFLTMVTQHRVCNLGEIVNETMKFSDFGKIVETEWLKSFQIRNELILHESVIMPNHLHAIVEINNESFGHDSPTATNSPTVTELLLSIKRNSPIRLPKSISSFIGGFKSAVNTSIDNFIDEHKLGIPKYNRNNHFFQPNYHDHIIRNHFEYHGIRNYIANNPKNWDLDKLKNN